MNHRTMNLGHSLDHESRIPPFGDRTPPGAGARLSPLLCPESGPLLGLWPGPAAWCEGFTPLVCGLVDHQALYS